MGYSDGFDWLNKYGLANVHAPDVSGLVGRNQDLKATYCSSSGCAGNTVSTKGKLVHVGAYYLQFCPKCRSEDFLYFNTISKLKADKFLASK